MNVFYLLLGILIGYIVIGFAVTGLVNKYRKVELTDGEMADMIFGWLPMAITYLLKYGMLWILEGGVWLFCKLIDYTRRLRRK